MRSPNLNISSRTPNITARINPNVAGIAGQGVANTDTGAPLPGAEYGGRQDNYQHQHHQHRRRRH